MCTAGQNNDMATIGDLSMISPPTSSISNDQDPFGQLPPLPPPLRSTQVLQPLSVFPVSNLSEDSYDYVFGGRRKTPPTTTSTQLKLTSPPVRLRPEDAYRGANINNGRFYRHSFSYAPKRQRHSSRDDRDRESRLRCHGEDEATLRQLLLDLQKQVSVMSMNLSAKLDELQRGDRHLETTVALCEIRTQLQELTKSVESCQSEVSEVKRDMVAIKHELDTVQQVKEEIEELREYVDRLEEHTHRRKLRLLEQNQLPTTQSQTTTRPKTTQNHPNIHPPSHTEPLTAETATMTDRCKCSSDWPQFLSTLKQIYPH